MNTELSDINKNHELIEKLFLNSINNLKEKKYHEEIISLTSIKELIIKTINQISTINNIENKYNIKILNKEIITHLSFFSKNNLSIKDSNIISNIKNILNDILIILLEEKNYMNICDENLIKDFITNCLNIIYLNPKTNLVFLLLIKKIDNYIKYINENFEFSKDEIFYSRKSFKDFHSKPYLKYKNELEELNIYKLSKSEELKDKEQSLILLSKFFNNLQYFTEKYDLLNRISREIFPSLLNLSLPSLIHTKNSKYIDLYIKFGKFLLKFLFNSKYIFDFSVFNSNSKEIKGKYPCLFIHNKNELSDFGELNGKEYLIIYKYDIIKEYINELVDIIIDYYVKPMIIYDTNFDIQFIIFKLLKYLYFISENKTEKTKNKFIKYIPEILNNLSFFKKQEEFDKALESREFGYYLLLKDYQFKYVITSLTNSPKNEIDIYTTKFNMAHNLLNNWFYEKEEIENGKNFEIFEKMENKYSIIYLELYIEDNKEITVTVYMKNEKDNKYKQIGLNNVIKTIKNDKTNDYKIAKIIIINSSSNNNDDNNVNYKNEFKIVFDNYDSWFTNRIIHYSISVFENSNK